MAPIPIPRNFNDPSSGDGNGKPQGSVPSESSNPSASQPLPSIPPLPTAPPKVPPFKIPLSVTPTPPIAPKPPISSFAQVIPAAPQTSSFTGERPPMKQEATPMLKDFPTIPVVPAGKAPLEPTPKLGLKPMDPIKAKISPSIPAVDRNKSAEEKGSLDPLLGYLAVAALILAIISAALLGAGYFEIF